MKRKYKGKFVLTIVLGFLLLLTACGTSQEKTTVAKLDIVEEEEESSGGMSVDIDNPEDEEELEDSEEKEESENGNQTDSGTTRNLTVATYNIAAGRVVNFDYSIIAADIVNSGADVVALQEIDQMTLRNGSQDTMEILASQTGMKYYAFAPALSPYQEGEYGIAVLSKYPIESYIYMDLPKGSTKEEQRVLLHTEINVNGNVFDFFVTHGQQSSITQQLAAANDYISSSSKYIFAGDFNTANYSYFQVFKNSYTIIGPSNPILTSAKYSFDNMVISNNIQSSNVRTYNTGHSDHYMVLTNVIIP